MPVIGTLEGTLRVISFNSFYSFLCKCIMQARLSKAESKAALINKQTFETTSEHTIAMQNLLCEVCPNTSQPFQFVLSTNSDIALQDHRELFICLLQFMLRTMRDIGHVIPFNTIQISKNIITSLQHESKGLRSFRAFGPFTGGELQLNTEYYITHDRTIFFEASELHAHRWFRGTKFALTTLHANVKPEEERVLRALGCPYTEIPLSIPYQLRISILSRDLGSFNTYVTSSDMRLELPYKRQGVWALHLKDDLTIDEKDLMDTYYNANTFELKEWDHTIYTVSDTACAASRPLPNSFYEKIFTTGLRLPRIDYRTPFLFFISKKWGNVAMIGDRRLPFMASLYFNGSYMNACSSCSLHNDYQELHFE